MERIDKMFDKLDKEIEFLHYAAVGVFFIYYAFLKNYQTRLIYAITFLINFGTIAILDYSRKRIELKGD